MNALVGMSVAGLVGTNIVSRTVNRIVQAGVDAVSFFRSGSSSAGTMSAALRKIEELDIKIKIKILQKFLNTYNPAKMSNKLETEKLASTDVDVFPDICEDMDKIVANSCSIIEKIENTIQDHGTKWLNQYRIFDVSKDLADLELYNSIMKNRIDMLLSEKRV